MTSNERNNDLSTISTIIDNNRGNNNICDKLANTIPSNSLYKKYINKNDNSNVNIYRYKFTNDFMDELYKFSKIHQYDHRHDFKEAWNVWVEENTLLVNFEIKRLVELGYDGDIIDKMFKSARYYFRKKSATKKEPVKRREYISIHKDILIEMDKYISINKNIKPSVSFNDFCKNNTELIKNQINELCKIGITDADLIREKFKKTYKNRYFIIIKE
jgi:hypothetical protein